jgi:hypothetical protein
MGIPASPELKALLADTLRIGGEVFGPLPHDVRRRLRFILYDIMETLPPSDAAQASLIDNLSDQFFIPNRDKLDELTQEVLAISRDRFALFVQRVLEAGAAFVLQAIEDFIAQAVTAVLKWVGDIETTIRTLFDRLAQLEQAVQHLVAQAQQAFALAVQRFETLLGQFSHPSLRTSLRQGIAHEFFRRGKSALADNPLYRSLPQGAKEFVKDVLKNLISDAIEGPVLDPVFAAISGVAGELEGVLEDVRALNPNEPLAPQLLDLVIDRVEDGIRDAFGGANPRIDVGFNVSVLGFSQHFGLGTIDVPFDKLFSILRDAIAALNFYETALQATASALADAFQKSLDLEAKQGECDTARVAHDRLDRIRREFTAEPKTVTIVSPMQSLVYDDHVDMRISLGGVPASYLGLEPDAQQRVLVFLNGSLVPLDSLAVEDTLGGAGTAQAPASTRRPGTAGQDGLTVASPAGQTSIRRAAAANVAATPGRATNALPLRPSLRSLAAGRIATSSRPVTRQSVTASADGRVVSTTVVANVLPGRRLTPTKRDALEATLPPGLTISFTATRDSLVVGTNTLAVVVIDPGGQRYQQAVSFAVTAPPKRIDGKVPTLPALPGRLKSGNPAQPPKGIDLHFNQRALADRLKSGRELFAKKSAAHFSQFRVRS